MQILIVTSYFSLLTIVSLLFTSCHKTSALEQILELSGENRIELEKVLQHYQAQGDEQKIEAAKYLISNMRGSAYYFDGDILTHYDIIFHLYDSIRQKGILVGDPPVITTAWDSLVNQYGLPDLSRLQVMYDCQHLRSELLINNIDAAFKAWESSPLYNGDFDLFCQNILPYRIQHEYPEDYREKYYNEFKHILDTVTSPEGIIKGFHTELYWNKQYRPSNILWDYPADIPISKMEIGKRGACRHTTTFQALVMRACGLPVSIDRAIWANRSQAHSWNVLLLDSGKILPFDALNGERLQFAYKPAKIFRTVFPEKGVSTPKPPREDVPSYLVSQGEIDVTAEYGNAFDVEIPIQYPYEKNKKYAVICVFENNSWRVVHWGEIKGKKMSFKDMCADVLYLAAYYEDETIFPASDPFLLLSDGSVQFCIADANKKQAMKLERKYPLFKRVEDFAWGLRRANIEASNNPAFNNKTVFFSIYELPLSVTDYSIKNEQRFRYVRLNTSTYREGNLAEIEFYGKKTLQEDECKLDGEIIGYPISKEDNLYSYIKAMDGDLETWFQKEKNTIGWVGLDLGRGNEHIITRVRLCPRSDTNFILEEDEYELFYWDRGQWNTCGRQRALQYHYIEYKDVPSNAMYLLHNHSRGKEERIFTYENEKQVWW